MFWCIRQYWNFHSLILVSAPKIPYGWCSSWQLRLNNPARTCQQQHCPVHLPATVSVLVLGDSAMQASVRRLALYPLVAARSGQVRGALCSHFPHPLYPSTRTLFSKTGVWEKDYRTETRRRVEEWWHPRIMAQWQKEAVEEVRKPFTLHNVPFSVWAVDMII